MHPSQTFLKPGRKSLIEALWSAVGLFTFPIFAASVFGCMIYLWIPTSMADPDIWWHLRNAEIQLTSHAFLSRDLYSFTAHGSAWMNHEWLAEIPFYLGWRLMGEQGVFLVTVAAIETVLLGVFYLSYKKSKSAAAAMSVSILAAFVSTVSFGPRTLLFGWICLVLELLILDELQANLRLVWELPLLFLLWVNLHGSWIIGIVVLLLFVVSTLISMKAGLIESEAWPWEHERPLIASACLSLGALFINPYGWRLVTYPFDLAFRQKLNIGTVEEWKTLDFHSPRGKVFLASIGLLFALQLLKGLQWRLYELGIVALGVYASVTYSRFLFLGAILVMPVLARYLFTSVIPRTSHYAGWIGVTVLLGILPSLYQHFPAEQTMTDGDKKYPFNAIVFLHRLPPHTRVFNEFAWGGYLEWNLRDLRVFIDSRIDLFEYNGTFRDYLDVIQIRNSLAILDRQKIQYVLFEHDTPLAYLLEHSTEWKVAYQDDSAEVLERIDLKEAHVPDPD